MLYATAAFGGEKDTITCMSMGASGTGALARVRYDLSCDSRGLQRINRIVKMKEWASKAE